MRADSVTRRCLAAAIAALTVSLPGVPAAAGWRDTAQVRVNQDAQLIAEFSKRVQAYVELHKKADSAIPEVSNSATPEQVDGHRRALQKAIGTVRANAEPGDIFSQPIRAYFRRQISRVLSGPDAATLRSAIADENPGAIRLRVNAPYPNTVPISTMPPQVLAAMPKLPPELEFHFIGNRLILLDIHAELVVDYIDAAVPR